MVLFVVLVYIVCTGLVGVAVKPAVGMFDSISKASQGLYNHTRNEMLQPHVSTATHRAATHVDRGLSILKTPFVCHAQERDGGSHGRVRPPRPIGPNGELREYDIEVRTHTYTHPTRLLPHSPLAIALAQCLNPPPPPSVLCCCCV